MEVKGFIGLHLQITQLHKKVGFLGVLSLATNMLLGTVFISHDTGRILPKTETISHINASPVLAADRTKETSAMVLETADPR